MSITTTAPSITAAEIGSKAAGIVSKIGDGVKVAGSGLIRVGSVAATAIFTTQSLGVDSDKIPGVMMGGRTQTQSQSKVEESDASCTANNPNCKDKNFHRGNIQAQEEKGMLVVTPAISLWHLPTPPGYTFALAAANAVRLALMAQGEHGIDLDPTLGLVKGDRGKDFQKGADKAHATLLKILNDNKLNGIFAIPKKYEVSCYFDGKKFFGANLKYKNDKSRRIDLTVHKGQIMGPGTL